MASARHVVGYMQDFLFTPEQARTPVGKLSGGERGRLMLARALAQPSNLLVLDEPTNDLDLETLDLLQEMLADYPGTVLLVSHDRDFLDRVATSVIVGEGDGRWIEYAGGYSDMVAQRGYLACRSASRADATAQPPANGAGRAPGAQPQALLQRAAGGRELPGRVETPRPEVDALERNSPTPTSPSATPPPSRMRRTLRALARRARRPPRTSGSGSRSCARSLSGSRPA